MDEYTPTKCEICSSDLIDNTKRQSYLVTMGFMKRFSMSSKKCTDCKIISYPELYKYGFFNIGQKLLLGFDLILDLYNAMLTGTPIIQYLQLKLDLLSQTFEGTEMKANLKNISLNIEQCAVSILSLLITEDCMNSKVCLVCGRVAYCICTDGNVKNASKIQDNMFFEKIPIHYMICKSLNRNWP